MRNVIQVIMAIKEVASEIISHGPAQCHPSVATRTPPSIWATSKGDVTMWAWHRVMPQREMRHRAWAQREESLCWAAVLSLEPGLG